MRGDRRKMTDRMNSKTILVTGATNGIGKVAALELAKLGAAVAIVGRSPEKTQATVREIQATAGHPAVEGFVADLSSIAEVHRLAEDFRGRHTRLDVLINNAGGIYATRRLTADGYEYTFALNHLAYFLLTNLLLDILVASAPARIINVASQAHLGARLDFDDLQNEKGYGYGGYRAYGQSKLANILFTYELARRLSGAGVTANALHPGTVATGFGVNNDGIMRLAMRLFHRFSLAPEEGADTIVYLAASPEVEGQTGKYWVKRTPVRSSQASYDEVAQKRLWEVSAQLTGLADVVGAEKRPLHHQSSNKWAR